MTRERFMRELREALDGLLPDTEIEEILADHAEFFDTGLAEGNTEEEVAERLGEPTRIALALLQRETPVKTSHGKKVPVYKRAVAHAVDAMVPILPLLWLGPRLLITGFFWPQSVAEFLSARLSTVQATHGIWARLLWAIVLFSSAAWFLLVNPACLWLLKGQTLGKWLQGIRVVDSAGGAVSPVQAMVREVLNKLVLNALFSSLWSPYAGVVPSLISLVWCWVSPRGMTI